MRAKSGFKASENRKSNSNSKIEFRKSKFEFRGGAFLTTSPIYIGGISALGCLSGALWCCYACAFGQASWWFPVCQLWYVAGGLGFCPEWYVAPAPPWGGVSEVSLWLLKLHGYCDCLIVHELHVLTGGLRLDIALRVVPGAAGWCQVVSSSCLAVFALFKHCACEL